MVDIPAKHRLDKLTADQLVERAMEYPEAFYARYTLCHYSAGSSHHLTIFRYGHAKSAIAYRDMADSIDTLAARLTSRLESSPDDQ